MLTETQMNSAYFCGPIPPPRRQPARRGPRLATYLCALVPVLLALAASGCGTSGTHFTRFAPTYARRSAVDVADGAMDTVEDALDIVQRWGENYID